MRKKGKRTMKGGSRQSDEQRRQQALRGMKKKAMRAMPEMTPMFDDKVREALRRFSSILRESGMTGSGSLAVEYRECRRQRAAVKN
jgi:hypothetical protein